MKYFFLTLCFALLLLSSSSCKKCYNCTKKCGTCSKTSFPTKAGCDGDTALLPYTVDTWKVYLESQGYTCAYNNVVANDICGADNKTTYEEKSYTCISK